VKIKLAYGKKGLDINLPDCLNVDVVEPEYTEGLPDQAAANANSSLKYSSNCSKILVSIICALHGKIVILGIFFEKFNLKRNIFCCLKQKWVQDMEELPAGVTT